MKENILNYLHNLTLKNESNKIDIPSIRWFATKFNVTPNDVLKVINSLKYFNILISNPGSGNYIDREKFLKLFKNDSLIFFGESMYRKIISIAKNVDSYTIKREFWKNGEIVSLSIDHLFTGKNITKQDVKNGVDNFIKENISGTKTVWKNISSINIKTMEEIKILKKEQCLMLEVMIYSDKNQLLSHSFSLFPVEYFKSTKIEMMI